MRCNTFLASQVQPNYRIFLDRTFVHNVKFDDSEDDLVNAPPRGYSLLVFLCLVDPAVFINCLFEERTPSPDHLGAP